MYIPPFLWLLQLYSTGGSAAARYDHSTKYDLYLIFVGGASHKI